MDTDIDTQSTVPWHEGSVTQRPQATNVSAPVPATVSQNGNLKYTTNFRSVYATVLDRWLSASSKDVLGGSFGSQNFLPQP